MFQKLWAFPILPVECSSLEVFFYFASRIMFHVHSVLALELLHLKPNCDLWIAFSFESSKGCEPHRSPSEVCSLPLSTHLTFWVLVCDRAALCHLADLKLLLLEERGEEYVFHCKHSSTRWPVVSSAELKWRAFKLVFDSCVWCFFQWEWRRSLTLYSKWLWFWKSTHPYLQPSLNVSRTFQANLIHYLWQKQGVGFHCCSEKCRKEEVPTISRTVAANRKGLVCKHTSWNSWWHSPSPWADVIVFRWHLTIKNWIPNWH